MASEHAVAAAAAEARPVDAVVDRARAAGLAVAAAAVAAAGPHRAGDAGRRPGRLVVGGMAGEAAAGDVEHCAALDGQAAGHHQAQSAVRLVRVAPLAIVRLGARSSASWRLPEG